MREHNALTDPRAAEQRIGPAQRFALEVLRDPMIAMPAGAVEADEALSVERSSTVRRALSEIAADVAAGRMTRDEAATRIVGVVASFGLRPVEAPPLVDPITEEDVGVVCWMAVLP